MTIYTDTARFDSGRALSEDELRKLAPSIFAVDKHRSRSDRFTPIPTIEILRGLAKEGFAAVGAKQSSARLEDKRDYTKHLIRMRKMDDGRKHQVGDTVVEMLLKNANDGTCCYDLMAGLFRIRCLNSLVAQTSTIDTVKIKHTGDIMGQVIEGTYRVLNSADTLLEAPVQWSKIPCEQGEKLAIAQAAHHLRFGDEKQEAITPNQFLIPRRSEDTGADLWSTFNVIQENMIKGGLSGWRRDEDTGRRRRYQTREIKGIDQDVRLNKALWIVTERFAQLKKAAIAA